MTSLITRCPKCATAFNVTEAHLSTANGSVRCGSCLNVFNGRENLVNAQQKQTASALLDDDDLLISDDLELEDHEHEEPAPQPAENRVKEILEKAEEKEDEADDDESWALKLLEEEGHNPSQLGLEEDDNEQEAEQAPSPTTEDAAPSDKAISQEEIASPAEPEEETITDEDIGSEHINDDKGSEEVPRAAILEDAESAEHYGNSAETDEPLTPAAIKAQEYADAKAQEDEPQPEIAEEDFSELEEELKSSRAPASPQSEDDGAVKTLVDAIELEAVEMQYTAKRPAWLSRLIWLVLALLATAALGGQIAWMKFDQWSLQEPYREYYSIACEQIGCELPQLRDLTAIRTSNLLVRSHPSTPDALLVDVVIQNHAKFEQPFPKLTLVFSNIKNKVVASREFSSDEYLGGDLQGATMMPSQRAIHLSLELVDPGKGAVSYKIAVNQ